MASGIIELTRTGYGQMFGRIVWESVSNGTEANTSTVTATLQVSRKDSYVTTGTWRGNLKVGGTTENFAVYHDVSSGWFTLKTVTTTVSHNSDGSGSCYIYGTIQGPGETSMEYTSTTGSKTVTLDTIPRFAVITAAPNFNDEENPSITYSNPAGNQVGSLQACISFDKSKDDIVYRDISKTGTSYTFNLTSAERDVLRAATTTSNSRTVYFFVRSTIGNAKDTDNLGRTLTIKNPKPTINPTITDSNSTTVALTGDSSKLIKYYSNAAVTIGAAAVKKASLKSQKVVCGNKSLTANGTMTAIESNSFVFTATDSRGNTTKKTVKPSFVNYVKLTCSLGNNMPDGEGNMTVKVNGNYFNGSFGAKSNSLNVYYRYKTSGGSYGSWTAMTVSKSGNTYSATANLTGLDYQTSYVFQTYAKDVLATVYSAEKVVKSTPVFDWGESDFNFNVPVNMKDGCDILKNGKVAYAKADAIGTNKVFNKLTDIGITTFPTTMKAVANAMPANSTLMLDSRDIIADSINEISDLGIGNAGMYIFMRGNSNARLSLLHIYGATGATTSYMNFGCYAATNDEVMWSLGERQNATYPDCRYRIAADGTTEWINPPMAPGVEYRTTERNESGMPVYCKLISYTNSAAIGSDSSVVETQIPHNISSFDALVRVTGRQGGVYPIPGITSSGNPYAVSRVTSTYIYLRTVKNSFDSRTWFFTVYYTKK